MNIQMWSRCNSFFYFAKIVESLEYAILFPQNRFVNQSF